MDQNYKEKYLKYKNKYLKLKSELEGGLSRVGSDLKDYIIREKPSKQLRLCAPHRMQQQSGTCWYDAIINIIILTPRLKKNMYDYINSLPQSDKKIIYTELKTFASLNLSYDNKKSPAYRYRLKHLIGALFTLFKLIDLKRKNIIKPNRKQDFSADQAARVKSIYRYGYKFSGEYNLNAELTYLSKKKKPKFFGTAGDPYIGMSVLMRYFNLNHNNDIIIIKGPVIDPLTKNLKLNISSQEIVNNNKASYKKNIKLYNNYSLEAICYDKFLGFHASAGTKCNIDKNKYIIYDSNNVLKYENWYETQKNYVLFSVYVVKM